ncbi:MAG: metallophosphoesterase [Lachnospiraceae bacterium]|nr:metallophosphoesterase [Lachnospiraceae bacterium]
MWFFILGGAVVMAIVGAIYLVSRFRRFGIVRAVAGERVWLQRLLACIPLVGFAVYGLFETVNAVIILLHLAAFWLIGDLVTLIVRKVTKKSGEGQSRVYWTGIIVLLVCAVYLAIGRYNAFHVDRTGYELTTDKSLPNGKLRVVLIADSHVGTTFDGAGFAEYMQKIQAEHPDIVIFAGDFVDDSTTREDMIAACRALGSIQTTYGVFYSYGNHDKGYYNSRGYTPEELETELTNNSVTVLEDEVVSILDEVYIIGRMDRNEGERKNSSKKRMSMEEITKELDKSRYMIVIDHQPNDYAAEAASGVDLVLSGHTHGGQLIPLGPVGRLMGANDAVYGKEIRDNTTFIVTSGISDWEIDYKTGTKSEYVVIDIVGH